jgi:hypothetical protein
MGALLDVMDLRGDLAEAAALVSTRHEHREAATRLLRFFEAVGRDVRGLTPSPGWPPASSPAESDS